jgi:hypothetical protein
MRLRNLVLGALAAASMLLGVLVMPADAGQPRPTGAKAAATADGAGTRSCSHAHSNLDPRSGQFFDASGVYIRTGPHTSCTALGQGQLTHNVDYHCWAVGDTVNGWSTWTYLRDTTTGVSGWVSDSLLDYRDGTRGSTYAC